MFEQNPWLEVYKSGERWCARRWIYGCENVQYFDSKAEALARARYWRQKFRMHCTIKRKHHERHKRPTDSLLTTRPASA